MSFELVNVIESLSAEIAGRMKENEITVFSKLSSFDMSLIL